MEQKTILLVEDDFLNRRLTKKILSENNYNVIEAKNTTEAISLLKQENISLAILDINLGENEENGISLGHQIKEKFNIPFIYLTAYENSEIIINAISSSPYSYLTKPFKNSDLIASIEIAIRQSSNLIKPKSSIFVKDGEFTKELPIDDIIYIESEGNYLLFYTDKKIYKTRSTIKKMLEELPSAYFTQTHRAYIVNKRKIEKFKNNKIIIGDIAIPISENYNDHFKK